MSLSYMELANLQSYAECVVDHWQTSHAGAYPQNADEAETAINTYAKEHGSFEEWNGRSVENPIEELITCIGMIVEAE